MWKNKLVFALTFSIFIGISLSGPPESVFAQEIPPNNSNTSGIMNNTTGMIDDAFDALKDSFGTFFGGN
ncbi:MAG TPA: hypothetical protein VIA09_06345 [Nitrososphaeraceae archaeon]|jgi:hypothetical protein